MEKSELKTGDKIRWNDGLGLARHGEVHWNSAARRMEVLSDTGMRFPLASLCSPFTKVN